MKILIDTNIFLDFYRTNTHPVEIFNLLKENISSIIITDQIIQEFERNREVVLNNVKQKFQLESKLENFSSSYVQNIEEFKQLIDIQREYSKKQAAIIDKINHVIYDPSLDPIAVYFKELIDDAYRKDLIYFTTDDIIMKADKRKKIGNPPVSNKYSIGDEINWEIVLANVKDDIIIVGRDGTYTSNFSFLQKDFHKQTGKIIYELTDSIISAFGKLGVKTDERLVDQESKVIRDTKHFNEFWKHNSAEN
jgi:predicted nucleic acid-binding protein